MTAPWGPPSPFGPPCSQQWTEEGVKLLECVFCPDEVLCCVFFKEGVCVTTDFYLWHFIPCK